MNNIENLLSRLDAYFSGKKKNEIYAIFCIVFIIVFYICYMFVFDISQKYYDKNVNLYDNIMEKVSVLNQDMSSQKELNVEENLLKKNINKIQNIKDDVKYLDSELKKLSAISFEFKDKKSFLNYIAKEAQENGVFVTKIVDNSQAISQLSVGKIQDINVEFISNFGNFVKFINAFEQSNFIIELNNIIITSIDDKLYVNMNISAWGVMY